MLTSQRAKVQWEALQATVDTTTPENLFASFHRQLPEFQRSASAFAGKEALEWLGMADAAAIARYAAVDYAQACLESLLPRLAPQTSELVRNKRVLVAEINSHFPAAQMWQCDDGRCAIVFTRALHQVYYRVVRALCTRLSPTNSEEVSLPFEVTCEIVSDIAFWYKNSLESVGPTYPITPNQVKIASRITKEAMVFCLAHELSHAVFRLHSDLAHLAQSGKDEEFSADLFALVALLSRADASTGEALQIRFCAAEMFLWVQIIFERLGLEFCFNEHPTFRERLDRLRFTLPHLSKSHQDVDVLCSMADCFVTLCGLVLENLVAPEEERALTRAARSRLAELDALLDECTGRFVPDYASFYPRAAKLLEQPGSEMFFEIMSRCAEDFADTCVANTKAATEAERYRAFQKFKLFLGLTQEINEPVRSIFMSALDRAASKSSRSTSEV